MSITEEKNLKPSGIWPWLALFTCCMLYIFAMGLWGVCRSMFFSPLAAAFNAPYSQVSMQTTIQTLAMVLCIPVAGKILSKYPDKMWWVIALCCTMDGLCFLLASRATSLMQINILIGIYGIFSSATHFVAIPIILSQWFKTKLGFATGIAIACSGIGSAIFSPWISGVIAASGWQHGYVMFGLVGLIGTVPWCLLCLRSPGQLGRKPYGYDEAERVKQLKEISARNDLVNETEIPFKAIRRMPAFYLLVLMTFMFDIQTMAQIWFSAWGQADLGMTAVAAASILSVQSFVSIFGRFAAGWLNDKLGVKFTTASVWFFNSLGLLFFVILCYTRPESPTGWLYAGAAFYGLGNGVYSTQPPLIVRKTFGAKGVQDIWPWCTAAGSAASMIGIPLFGLVKDVTGSFSPIYIIMLSCNVLAFIVSLVTIKSAEESKQKYIASQTQQV